MGHFGSAEEYVEAEAVTLSSLSSQLEPHIGVRSYADKPSGEQMWIKENENLYCQCPLRNIISTRILHFSMTQFHLYAEAAIGFKSAVITRPWRRGCRCQINRSSERVHMIEKMECHSQVPRVDLGERSTGVHAELTQHLRRDIVARVRTGVFRAWRNRRLTPSLR